ncbi:MAG: putative universal stress protein UspA and related nucleotide-binding protein [Rhodospirillales bacterium]|nr:putative universal stress protein UspA and related nucleotide-binding protein [Rhodospirillales bacterium]
MTKTILIALENEQMTEACLQAAYEVGCELDPDARFEALVLRPDPLALMLPTEEILTEARLAEMDAHDAAEALKMQAHFDRWAKAHGIIHATFTCKESMGCLPTELAHRGRIFDLVVLASPAAIGKIDRPALTAALFETHRPVLLVPTMPPPKIGQRVAVAWRDDERAPKVLLAAMPLLARAEAVFVLVGRKEGMTRAPPVPQILVTHGIEAEVILVGSDILPIRAALLHQARVLSADLLIMGAYAHSRVREMIFGGVTRHVLAEADLPVLMRH